MGRADEAYAYLKEEILSNRLPQGGPISEMAVSEKLQMSRTPVREALRILEQEGLVVNYPSRGSFVAVITALDIEEIYELRMLLEVWALERGFMYIRDSDLDVLEEKFAKGYQEKNWALIHEADAGLHSMFIKKSGSKRAERFLNILNGQLNLIRQISAMHAERLELSYQEHREIIRHIRERNLPKAKDALHYHLRNVSKSAVEVLRIRDVSGLDL